MLDQLFSYPARLQHIRIGPLSPYLDTFATMLLNQGYTRSTIKCKVRTVSYISRWFHRRRLSVKDLNEEKIVKFFQHRRRRYHIQGRDAPTLHSFLSYLRDIGAIPIPTPKIDNSELGRIERSFTQYLVEERNLSQVTLRKILRFVRQFLTRRFGKGPILLDKLRPRDSTNFILRYPHSISPVYTKSIVSALRSFFRFLRLRGDIVIDLAASVPVVANWQFSTVPKYISPEQIERLLQSCDQNTIVGQRSYAILLLLVRLGLRASEVANITLDDIDWEAGEIIIRGKGSRRDRLPLLYDVGKAMATYLRHGRPSCSMRQVFIRINAPHRRPITYDAIYRTVRCAFERAGVQAPQKSPHILRHSLATEMLRKGASLAEISQILRHRSLNTTKIYTKIDLEALRTLVQPWPGGKS